MRTAEDELERLLEREFAGAFETIADDGFSDRVLARLRRHARIRIFTLSLATAAGLAIAFVPLMQIADALAGLSPLLTESWRLTELPGQYRYMVAAVLLGLASPLLIRLLER